MAWVWWGLAGCSLPSASEYTAQIQGQVGRPIGAVIAEWGEPARKDPLPPDHHLYVWEVRGDFELPERMTAENQSGKQLVVTKSGGQVIPVEVCTTLLETDKGGVVVRASAQGLGCVAFPGAPAP